MSWETVKLDDICELITCGVAKRPEYVDDGIPFLSSLNVKENRFILKSFKKISFEDYQRLNKYSKPEVGDILYTRVGSFGEAAVIDLDFKFSIFVSLTLIKPKKDIIDSRFLMWHLNSPNVKDFASKNTSGIGVQNLNVGVVRKYKIPLPPLTMQKQIAEILDKADALRKKDLELLKHYTTLAEGLFIDMFGDPVKNEKDWNMRKLGEFTSLVSSGATPLGGSKIYQKTGIHFIRSQNVLMHKVCYDGISCISDDIHNTMKRTWVKNQDVLLNITGASIGRVAVFEGKDNVANVNQHVCIIRTMREKLVPLYLSNLISNNSFQTKSIGNSTGGTREAFNFNQIKSFDIIYPPIELQNQFATQIQNIELQKEKVKAQIQASENLFQALLQRTFKDGL